MLRSCTLTLIAMLGLGSAARAHAAPVPAPSAIAVMGPLPQLPADVSDLKFRELFTLPVGPRGLVPSARLMALAGKRVRLIGYMAQQEDPVPGLFIFAALPVMLGDADDNLADDLPPSSVFVHVTGHEGKVLPFFPGLLRLTGTLALGAFDEVDGHVSAVRLQLDPDLAVAMLERAAPASH